MKRASHSPALVATLGSAAVAASIMLGIVLRLVDPLSSPVIPAEDPYTHMAYVREHLRTGTLDPLNPPGGLYPPGLHALLAAVWAFSGAELYEIIRLGPVFFGAIGILGVGLLLWRFIGPIGAAIGSLGYAIAPEIVFRTTMMAPTALDLALLPFLLYALLRLMGGSIRYLAAALPLTLFFVYAHPWLFGILSAAAVVFVLLAIILPWRTAHSPAPSALGISIILALLVGGMGLALTGCGGYCGPGFNELLPDTLTAAWVGPLLIIGSATPAILLSRRPHALDRIMPGPHRRPLPVWAGLIMSGGIAALLAVITLPALQHGVPDQVDLPKMLGLPIIYLSFFALIALPFMAGRLSYVGAALFVPTYPMVIYDLLGNQYWPHRTAAFLGLAMILLLGTAAEFIVRWTIAAAQRLGRLAVRRRAPAAAPRAVPSFAVFAIALLAAGSVAGTVLAHTPEPYPDGWYRLYPPCELDAMNDVAAQIDAHPDAIVLAGDWRARVVLGALAHDPTRIWLTDAFYSQPEYRQDWVDTRAGYHDAAIFVVVDRHTLYNNRDGDLSFLDQHPWEHVGSWCAGMGLPEPRMQLYRTEGHLL